jgi:ABC-type uncharacterized transport system permease subunit
MAQLGVMATSLTQRQATLQILQSAQLPVAHPNALETRATSLLMGTTLFTILIRPWRTTGGIALQKAGTRMKWAQYANE